MSDREDKNSPENPPGNSHRERPPESDGGGPRDKEKKPNRFSFFWVLMVVMAVLLMGQFLNPGPKAPTWTEFTTWVEAGQVRKVVVTPKVIKGEHRVDDSGQEARWEPFQMARVTNELDIKYLQEEFPGYKSDSDNEGLFTILVWIVPVVLLIGFWLFMMRRMNPGQQVMSFGKSKAKIYAEKEVGVDFDDVAGIDEAVEEVKEIVEFLQEPQKFQALGARIPKGVLLLGSPGTGKTLLARAVAGEAKVPFFTLSGSDFVEMFVGVGASRVRDLFKQAAQHSPCIVFIDELDALGKTRGNSPVSNDEREQTLNALLVEMDGFDANAGVIIIAATNRPEILDAALMRPGRFDRQIVVDKPDIRGREKILGVHARNVRLDDEVDLAVIAARTPGFAGADLANVVNEAALLAARRNLETVTMGELEEAIDRTIAGLEKKKRLMTAKDKEIVSYHESGHALVASKLPHVDPVHRISIIPRGMGSLGHTLQLPTDERYLLTQEELRNRMCVLLGGRAAEKIIFGQVSTGAQNDLERCSGIARRMVTAFGMSEKMGAVSYEQEKRNFTGWEGLDGKKEYSEETAREIDEEVRKIVAEAEGLALKVLTDHRELLESIAVRLSEVELIDREELAELLGESPEDEPIEPPPPPAGIVGEEADDGDGENGVDYDHDNDNDKGDQEKEG